MGIAAVGAEVESALGTHCAPAVGAQFCALPAVVCPTGCADDSGDVAQRETAGLVVTLELGLHLAGAVVKYEVVVTTAEEFFAAKP